MGERVLPDPPQAQGSYVPAVVYGGTAFSAGMTPRIGGELQVRGTVDVDVSIAEARSAAHLAATQALAAIAAAVGGLDQIDRCLKMTIFIACTAAFDAHSHVADGASAALQDWLGTSRGATARAAVGVASLPSGAPVEVELSVAVRRTPGS